MTRSDLKRLIGWSLSDWLIRPRLLTVIDFRIVRLDLDDAEMLNTALNNGHCKLEFDTPKKIVASGLTGRSEFGFVVRDASCADREDSGLEVRLLFEGGGEIAVSARSVQMFFW
jgi:hypothetical protein